MAMKPLRDKIGWKPGQRVLLLNLPDGMESPFSGIAHTAATTAKKVSGKFDLVLAFTRDQAALASVAKVVLSAIGENPLLWLAYPKKSGAIPTDITRDAGWGPMFDAGYIVVAIAAVDEDWSAVRFRPKHLVKSVRYPG